MKNFLKTGGSGKFQGFLQLNGLISIPTVCLLLALAGCGTTTYVGNTRFDLDELCSREYASKLGWFSGGGKCVPPAAAANVQNYFYDRFRMPVSLRELIQIERRQKENESLKKFANISVPVAESSSAKDKDKKSVNYLSEQSLTNPIPNFIGRVFVTRNDESEEKAWIPPAHGNLFFLDTETAKREVLPVDLYNANDVPYPISKKSREKETVFRACPFLDEKLEDTPIVAMLKDIKELYGTDSVADRGFHHLGLITGAAVVRTRKAASASCHQMSTGINSGADSNDPSCQTLQDTLGKALALTDPSALKAKDVRLPTADELARRISLAYNKASYKTLQMDDHGGVLAIQWLPIDVRHTPKGKGQKAGGEK